MKYAFDEYGVFRPRLDSPADSQMLGNLGVLPSDSGTHCKSLARWWFARQKSLGWKIG